MAFYTFLVILPFFVFLFLLLFKKQSLIKSTFVALIMFLFLAIFVWQITPPYFYNSLIKGFFVALDILFIIIGALFFLAVLRHFHIIDHLIIYLESLSPDYRLQTIFLAWFLECFLEGIAGFGTPSTIVAPILVNLGLSPVISVVLALLGNSTSVAFGAAGTPIRTGFATLNLTGIAPMTAALNWVGLIIPVFMVWVVVRHRRRPLSDFYSAIPFALWSGFIFVVSSFLVANFSQELASILGSIIAFFIIFLSIRFQFLLPPKILPFPHEKLHSIHSTTLFKTIQPYLVLIFFLIIGKIFLKSISIPILAHQFQSFNLFNPGFAFILTTLIFAFIWRLKPSLISYYFHQSAKSSLQPFLIIFFMSALVQILSLSEFNTSGLTSMLNSLVIIIKNIGVPIITPFIGMFGSFITGSATISNIMFGSLLSKASLDLSLNPIIILSLQLAGASIGNMIALSDMITAEVVVGLKNHESQLLRHLLPYCLFLVFILSLIGYLISRP